MLQLFAAYDVVALLPLQLLHAYYGGSMKLHLMGAPTPLDVLTPRRLRSELLCAREPQALNVTRHCGEDGHVRLSGSRLPGLLQRINGRAGTIVQG